MEETNNASSGPTDNTPMQHQEQPASAVEVANDAAALMAFASVSASASTAAAPSNTMELVAVNGAVTDTLPKPLIPELLSPANAPEMQLGKAKDSSLSVGGRENSGEITETEKVTEPEASDAPVPSTTETKMGKEGGESPKENNSSPHQQQQPQSMNASMEEAKQESGVIKDDDQQENPDVEMKKATVEVSSKPNSEEPISAENGPRVAPLIAKIEEKISANAAEIPSANDNKEATGEDVQVIEHPPESLLLKKRTKSFEEHLERRKRRRKLRRMLKEAGEFPSFVALISASPNLTVEEEEEYAAVEEAKNKSPEVIYIDVDDYLGLTKPKAVEAPVQAPVVSLGRLRPNRTNSADPTASTRDNSSSTKATASPADEGYYEGRVPLASPGDDKYLSILQIMIRDNLEYFSATATDAAGSQSGRRYPVVRGKVGIRCIHCAKVGLEHEAAMAAKFENANNAGVAPDSAASGLAETKPTTGKIEPKLVDASKLWPPGSISYPLNIAGLYSVCSQKPQLHFENCPNMPSHIKAQFYRYVHEAGEARIKSREVPTPMYYSVAAKRVGLVNVPGGMRFGRDLTLEPLPLEAVLAQERQEIEKKKTQVIVPDQSTFVSEPEGVVSATPSSTLNVRIPADAASEQVLAEAVADVDVPDLFPSRASDKAHVSDYVFLCIRQLAICRAVPADMATRGKKTKSMRVGLAGFCCKHCLSVREQIDGHELARAHGASDYSCRSFSSTPDTLASSISNTFALHLAKCANVPARTRTALAAYKRFHASQMSNLPYGSQRKCFGQIWDRLRAADVPEDDMMIRISKYKETGIVPDWPANKWSPPASRPTSNGVKPSSSKPKQLGRTSPKFPVASGAEADTVLKNAIASLKSSNDNADLILPSDLELVSDYVFLTIRQLHVTLPTAADLTKRRPVAGQAIMAGMCCMHCEKEDPSAVAPSGRSFPSAADNFASALNTSLYNHMQNCQFMPDDIKRVLAILRKLHSQQIAHLKVGSQRRYFTKLYDRLRNVPVPKIPGSAASKATPATPRNSSRGTSRGASSSGARVTRRSENGDDAILAPFGFFEAPIQSFFCARCRMVPLALRARGSLSFARPSLDFMTEHSEACKGGGFDLWFVVESFKKLLKEKQFDLSCMTDPLFKDVIREAVGGNEDLTSIFTGELVKVYQMSRHGGVTRAVENYVKVKSEGMWCKFSGSVDFAKVSKAFEKFAAAKHGMSSKLADHSALVSFLLLLSPSLSMPGEEPEEDNNGNEDSDDEDVEGESEGEDEVSILDEDGEDDHVEMDDDGDENLKAPVAIKVGAPKRGKELRRKKPSPEEPPPEDPVDDRVNVSVDQYGVAEENGSNVVNGTQPTEQAQAQVDHSENTGNAVGLEGQGDVGDNNNDVVNDGGVAEHTDAFALMNDGIDEAQEEDMFMSDDGSYSHS